MKVTYCSDIHNEFKDRNSEIFSQVQKCDVLVIAGDLNVGMKKVYIDLVKIRKELNDNDNKDCSVIYVPGNHEFYGRSYVEEMKVLESEMKQLIDNNIFVMSKGTLVINNRIRFICEIGWPDHSNGVIDMRSYWSYNDFHQIKDFKDNHFEWGVKCRRRIVDTLKTESPIKYINILVTHWLPSNECIALKYKGNSFNPCFANNWDKIIKDHDIKLWIHGHSHESYDNEFDGTRFVRNPLGYPSENTNFRFKIIDI